MEEWGPLEGEAAKWIGRSVLCWMATVDEAGQPNVSPKQVFARLDGRRIAVAQIASPGTEANLRANPRVCVSFVDVLAQRGVKVVGTARAVWPGEPGWAEAAGPLEANSGGRFPLRAVLLVTAERVEAIVAPSYRLFPETTEAAMVEGASRDYGVTLAADFTQR